MVKYLGAIIDFNMRLGFIFILFVPTPLRLHPPPSTSPLGGKGNVLPRSWPNP